MFRQLLPNKNKNTTVQNSVATVIRDAPNRASKQGLTFSTHDCENQNPEAYHMCVWASVLCLVETTRLHIWNASADSELILIKALLFGGKLSHNSQSLAG
jgi:hypothetical protein